MYDIFVLSIELSVSRILLYIVRTFYFLNIILENTSYSFFLNGNN